MHGIQRKYVPVYGFNGKMSGTALLCVFSNQVNEELFYNLVLVCTF